MIFHADAHGRVRVFAHPEPRQAARLGEPQRRDWAALGPPPASDDGAAPIGALAFAPDGMCLDADGAAWVADAVANRAVRLAEGGEQLDEVRLDVGCFACMLGGDDGRTLFLCTAPNFAEHERRTTREARLLSARVDVPHAGTS